MISLSYSIRKDAQERFSCPADEEQVLKQRIAQLAQDLKGQDYNVREIKDPVNPLARGKYEIFKRDTFFGKPRDIPIGLINGWEVTIITGGFPSMHPLVKFLESYQLS